MPGSTQNSFQALVEALNERLGPSSGIDSQDVDAKELQQVMEDYMSDESEWSQYYFPSLSIPYTRNLVDKGNGKCNLLILVWGPDRESPIHDHANAHCIMKILKGSLTETRYAWPTVDLNNSEQRQMQVLSEQTYNENDVTYMSDKLGLHRIKNPNPNDYAVSLHLYTPPNAAVYGCNTFNAKTGHSSHMSKCTVFSEYGRQVREPRL